MYAVTVVRPFIAQHALTVPDAGPEGERHSHYYRVEVELTGESLNRFDYLLDIEAVETALDGIEDRYRDAFLNDLPEFEGDNPSVERFARVIHDRLTDDIDAEGVTEVRVTVWEDDEANAAYAAPP